MCNTQIMDILHWLWILDILLSFGERWDLAQKSHLMDKNLAFRYYSEGHLMSLKVRSHWQALDL